MPGKLFVISAPSGTGKTTLVRALVQEFKEKEDLKLVVTYTTRPVRMHEVNGQDYYFVTEEQFKLKIEQGFFLEWVEFCGYLYGSPAWVREPALRGKDSYIVVLDRAGGCSLKGSSDAILIWITPPSLEELRARLRKRAKDSEQIIEKRLEKARQELALESAEKIYPYHLINDNFSATLKELKVLIGRSIGSHRYELK